MGFAGITKQAAKSVPLGTWLRISLEHMQIEPSAATVTLANPTTGLTTSSQTVHYIIGVVSHTTRSDQDFLIDPTVPDMVNVTILK